MRIQFDEIIQELTNKLNNPEAEIITALKAKRDEVDDMLSENETEHIISDMMSAYIEKLNAKKKSADMPKAVSTKAVSNNTAATLSPETSLRPNTAEYTVRSFLDSRKWLYSTRTDENDTLAFEFKLRRKKIPLRIEILVQTKPNNICTIEAMLPITCDPVYRYPFSLMLSRVNRNLIFGKFDYIESDGIAVYEYATSTVNGLTPEEFEIYFNAAVDTAADYYLDIKRFCVGKYKSSEKKEILDIIKELVEDLDSRDNE